MSLSHNPNSKNYWFRLFPLRSPLLGESNFFLFLRLLRCFSSPGSLVLVYEFNQPYFGGCPIRTSPDNCLLPAPRSVSSVATSFFASVCLGIHRKPLVA